MPSQAAACDIYTFVGGELELKQIKVFVVWEIGS